jgi:hypothetical protein
MTIKKSHDMGMDEMDMGTCDGCEMKAMFYRKDEHGMTKRHCADCAMKYIDYMKSMHPMSPPVEDMASKAYEGCGCETCKAMNANCENCPVCISNSYDSDNEEMDKWNNMSKACWVGYEQRGMKDKGGRQVPNCVYVGKVTKSFWTGSAFNK